ncbi:uncharacterized protein BJ212DRAFT_1487734 [Suillus subaureus]|uniref:DUF6818 domain-containing protein n=1 Tax=Suillus subaureus TaxID=48587 RepID=A0A9P7DRG5_9AGAM|nr:uncharacterized protein BJ212DRAFT_1487734 [Suillus subaureus]KAG1801196.1 hypothetical protein BJ212DRAFT_1487734 [Suillus subaureus]
MSDIAPLQSMIPPGSSPAYPELHYNDAGNAYTCNAAGAWVPHPGICKAITTSQQSFCIKHGEPQLSLSCELGTYTLRTPAMFQSKEDTPLLLSSYHTPLHQMLMNSMIDPAFLPLPESGDLDLTDTVTIAEAQGHTPVVKAAGLHHQVKGLRGKGKTKENLTSANSKKHSREYADEDDEAHVQQGCPQGSNNYMISDVTILLDMVCQEPPLGQCGWQAVHVKFCQWVKANGHPEHKVTSLEMKFKQLVKTMKPTGDGVCPPDVTCALRIDQLINECAGTCDLDDMDFDTIEDDDNHSVVSNEINIQDEPYHTFPQFSTLLLHASLLTQMPLFRIAMLEELQLQISSLTFLELLTQLPKPAAV